jgi:ATP-dependent DNA helicase RecQ
MSSQIASHALLTFETGLARLILSTIHESTPLLGRPPSRGFVSAALIGSCRNDVTRADAHRLATYGVLSFHPLDRVRELVDGLVERGLVDLVTTRPGGLVVSPDGRAILEGQGQPQCPLGLVTGVVDATRLDLAIRAGLVDALRRYRADRAADAEIPEYRVFTEATLRELAAAAPSSPEALERIPGLGPQRLTEHGAELLRIVSEHLPVMRRLAETPPVTDTVAEAADPVPADPVPTD